MSRIEERLGEVLRHPADAPTPSPDLFERVMDSIDHDQHRRRKVRRIALAWALGLGIATAAVVGLTPRENGDLAMPWWILEVITNAVLVGIALWLGPFIKRFGRAYAADVFHDNPLTGKSYIVLTDIVYYLIFTAYILFSVRFEPMRDWGMLDDDQVVNAAQLKFEVERIGGILLIIGILHGANIVLMPVLGRLFSVNRKLSGSPER